MEIGNPKQVIALAVAAVGALGFLVSRLGRPSLPPLASVGVEAPVEVSMRPRTLLASGKDPFSHPRLAPVVPKSPVESEPPTERKPGPVTGRFAAFGPLPEIGEGTTEAVPLIPPKPREEPPKPSALPIRTPIALEAVVGATDPTAFLSVDGAESRPFRANDKLGNGIRLVRIEDGAVVLSGPKGEVSLDVGERRSL